MAKPKYHGLKGKIPTAPTQPTAKDEALTEALGKYDQKTIDQLTVEYVAAEAEVKKIAEDLKPLHTKMKALEILIMRFVKSQELDGIKSNGFNWSDNVTPYPVCEDPVAIVKYFKEHGMEEQLELSKTELASRLNDIVKNESLNNEFRLEITKEIDPETGEEKEVRNVYSQVDGVRIFLATKLSKTKA